MERKLNRRKSGAETGPGRERSVRAERVLAPKPIIHAIDELTARHISQDGPTAAADHEYCDTHIQRPQDRNCLADQPATPFKMPRRMEIIRTIMDDGFSDPKATQSSIENLVGRYVDGAIKAAAIIPAALDKMPDRDETDAYCELYMQYREQTGQFKHVDISGPRPPFRMSTQQDLKDDINGRPRQPSLKDALRDDDAEATGAAPEAPPSGDQKPKAAAPPDQDTTDAPAALQPQLAYKSKTANFNKQEFDAHNTAPGFTAYHNIKYEKESQTLWLYNRQDRCYEMLTDKDNEGLSQLIESTYPDYEISKHDRNLLADKIIHRDTTPKIWPDQWDTDRDLVHFQNGTLNLETMKFDVAHRPTDNNKFAVAVNYDPAAPVPPTFPKYLATALDRDPTRIWPLLEFLAQILHTDRPLHKFYILSGIRNTGKSTALRIGNALLGRRKVANTTLQQLAEKHGGESLEGAFACIVYDMDVKQPVDSVSTIKAAVYGEPIEINPKGRPLYSIQPHVLFGFSMNGLPKLPNDSGLNERMVIIQFRNSFDVGSPDRIEDLADILTEPAALSGIVNLLIPILRRLRRTHTPRYIQTPAEVYAAIKDIELEMDAFKQWVDFETNGKTPKQELYALYQTNAARQNNKPKSKQAFNAWLQSHGCTTTTMTVRRKRLEAWLGVGVNAEGLKYLDAGQTADQSTLGVGRTAPPGQVADVPTTPGALAVAAATPPAALAAPPPSAAQAPPASDRTEKTCTGQGAAIPEAPIGTAVQQATAQVVNARQEAPPANKYTVLHILKELATVAAGPVHEQSIINQCAKSKQPNMTRPAVLAALHTLHRDGRVHHPAESTWQPAGPVNAGGAAQTTAKPPATPPPSTDAPPEDAPRAPAVQ